VIRNATYSTVAQLANFFRADAHDYREGRKQFRFFLVQRKSGRASNMCSRELPLGTQLVDFERGPPIITLFKNWQLARFGLIGLVATLGYSVTAWELTSRTTWSPVTASVIAYSFAGVFSYFGHRMFSFRSKNSIMYEIPRFVITVIIGYSISSIFPYIFTIKIGTHPSVAIIAVSLMIPLFNFLFMKKYVFIKG